MSFLLYVICDSDYARGYTLANYDLTSATTLMVPSTSYKEHYALIDDLADRSTWDGKQYIGVMSWRANKRMVIPNFSQIVNTAVASNADVIALFCPSAPWTPPHPHFATMWAMLCSRLGYTLAQYESPNIPVFLNNDWFATPEWMNQYIQHIQLAYEVMETPEFKTKLRQSASVVGKRVIYLDACMILDRLPCLFFWAQGARISMNKLVAT